jgi:hypothetical protein
MRPVRDLEPFCGSFEFDGDVTCGLLAESNLHAVNPVDGRVTGGSTAKDLDVGPGKEAEMGQVIAHLVGKLQRLEDCGLSNSEIAEGHRLPLPDRYTTRAVVV